MYLRMCKRPTFFLNTKFVNDLPNELKLITNFLWEDSRAVLEAVKLCLLRVEKPTFNADIWPN